MFVHGWKVQQGPLGASSDFIEKTAHAQEKWTS